MTQKQKIVAHVSNMIMSLGVKSVRMDDVATEMGMSKRTLYEMFGDKEELLYQSIVYSIEQRQKNLTEKTKCCDNMLEVILISVKEICGVGFNSDLEHRLTTNLSKFYPNVLDKLQRYHAEMGYRCLKYALDKCNNDGLLDPNINVEIMSRLFLSTMSFYMSSAQSAPLPENLCREEAFEIMTINFLRGISSVKGIQVIDKILKRECPKEEN